MNSSPVRIRVRMISGDEYDALCKKSKRWYHWSPGVRKWIKKRFNKRLRKLLLQEEG